MVDFSLSKLFGGETAASDAPLDAGQQDRNIRMAARDIKQKENENIAEYESSTMSSEFNSASWWGGIGSFLTKLFDALAGHGGLLDSIFRPDETAGSISARKALAENDIDHEGFFAGKPAPSSQDSGPTGMG